MTGIAKALARSGRTVIAPALALADWKLDVADLACIAESIDLGFKLSGKRVVLVTFSFGSAFCLVALGETPRLQAKVSLVVTVGGYFDLVNLLRGVTTGTIDTDGTKTNWRTVGSAGDIVTMLLGGFLTDAGRDELLLAYRERDDSGLAGDPKAIYNLMTNKDPSRTRELVTRLPGELPTLIARLSPATHIDRISNKVLAMHSVDDPASPISESQALVASLGTRGSLYAIKSFRHVTPTGGTLDRLKDAQTLLALTMRIFQTR